jgi:hypothetical protein
LRAWLGYPGEPRRAAEDPHIHPNTLRHRMHRITALTPLGVDDPVHRLALQLQIEALLPSPPRNLGLAVSAAEADGSHALSSGRTDRPTGPRGEGRG